MDSAQSSTELSWRVHAIIAVLFAAGYQAGATLGLRLRVEPSGVAALWLPSGLMLATLLLTRRLPLVTDQLIVRAQIPLLRVMWRL